MYQWIYHWKMTPQVLGLLQCRLRVVSHPYHSANYLWWLCCSVIITTAVLCVWICILNRNCSIHRKAIYSFINTHIIYNISGAQTDICEVNLWFEAITCGDFGIVIQWMWHGDCFTNMILSFKCNKYHMLWTLTVLTHIHEIGKQRKQYKHAIVHIFGRSKVNIIFTAIWYTCMELIKQTKTKTTKKKALNNF